MSGEDKDENGPTQKSRTHLERERDGDVELVEQLEEEGMQF